jgi:hypothetical protein
LLDLFEKHINTPPAPVEIGNRLRRSAEFVGQEFHHGVFAVDLDQCHNVATN